MQGAGLSICAHDMCTCENLLGVKGRNRVLGILELGFGFFGAYSSLWFNSELISQTDL